MTENYGWIEMNSFYYVYDRKLHCITSRSGTDYLETNNRESIEKFVALLNNNEKLERQRDGLLAACKNFIAGWGHFCDCIKWDKTFLDAKAIQFMNEVPGEIQRVFTEGSK